MPNELETMLYEYELRGSWWTNVFLVDVLQHYFGWYFERRMRRRLSRAKISITEFEAIKQKLIRGK